MWQIVGQMPRPVWGGEAVVYDSSIIVMGGQDTFYRSVDWVQVYRPHVSSWQLVGRLRRPRQEFLAGRDSTHVYLVGGRRTGMGNPRDSTVEAFLLPSPSSSYYVDSNRFFARTSPAGVVHNGFLYIVGGFRVPGTPFLFEYDLASRTITYQWDTPLNAIGQMAERIDNDIYLFGGDLFSFTDRIWKFNVDSRIFQELPVRLRIPRGFGKAVRLGNQNRIMIVGGMNEAGPINSVEFFEVLPGTPPSYQVTLGPPNVFRRVACMAAYLHGSVYLFGGRDGNHSVSQIERYDVPTSVPDESELPQEYALLQNFPNPFNSSTIMQFWLPQSGFVSLKVFNVLGVEVATIFAGPLMPGKHQFTWDAAGLPSGVYLYQLRASSFQNTKKMILLR